MAISVGSAVHSQPSVQSDRPADGTLDAAHYLFFVGQYDEAAALALALRQQAPEPLTTYELRSSALHFRLKRELGEARDRKAAMRACAACAGLLADIASEVAEGRTMARERLKKDERDVEARFYLGKIDLTHVWLHLETLGQRTGWSEYWEARRSLDRVIEQQPGHTRALVARAWIDYIVDTRVPRGVRWMLGGGDRRGALEVTRKTSAATAGDRFARAEAGFAYWEMLTREKRMDEAKTVARTLLAEFPENRELAKFVESR